MLYHLTLSFNQFHAVLALAVTTLFILILLAKEKIDERKRA